MDRAGQDEEALVLYDQLVALNESKPNNRLYYFMTGMSRGVMNNDDRIGQLRFLIAYLSSDWSFSIIYGTSLDDFLRKMKVADHFRFLTDYHVDLYQMLEEEINKLEKSFDSDIDAVRCAALTCGEMNARLICLTIHVCGPNDAESFLESLAEAKERLDESMDPELVDSMVADRNPKSMDELVQMVDEARKVSLNMSSGAL